MPVQHVLPVEEIPQAREHVGCAFPTSNGTLARFLHSSVNPLKSITIVSQPGRSVFFSIFAHTTEFTIDRALGDLALALLAVS